MRTSQQTNAHTIRDTRRKSKVCSSPKEAESVSDLISGQPASHQQSIAHSMCFSCVCVCVRSIPRYRQLSPTLPQVWAPGSTRIQGKERSKRSDRAGAFNHRVYLRFWRKTEIKRGQREREVGRQRTVRLRRNWLNHAIRVHSGVGVGSEREIRNDR